MKDVMSNQKDATPDLGSGLRVCGEAATGTKMTMCAMEGRKSFCVTSRAGDVCFMLSTVTKSMLDSGSPSYFPHVNSPFFSSPDFSSLRC